ncbi:MAG: hypothetical protein AB2603_04465, partial [Candidatus Thiodiazotropha endolucinida]
PDKAGGINSFGSMKPVRCQGEENKLIANLYFYFLHYFKASLFKPVAFQGQLRNGRRPLKNKT